MVRAQEQRAHKVQWDWRGERKPNLTGLEVERKNPRQRKGKKKYKVSRKRVKGEH